MFRSRKMAVLFALGISSGLPYLLIGQTLQAWLTKLGVDLSAIAEIGLVGLAYNLKFLWAPLLDRYRLPVLGRRRGWVLACQLGLVAAIATLGAIDPVARPELLATVAIVVAFLSASQDVVLDAYSNDVLAPAERAAGAAVYMLGYRVGMLIAGTFAFVLANRIPWRAVYTIMAAVMALATIATLVADEPPPDERAPRTLAAAFVQPVRELIARFGARRLVVVLAFAALFELGYFVVQGVVTPFLLRADGGFTLDEIAVVNKGMIFLGLAIGGTASGALVARRGPWRMLVPFGALAAATHLLYALLALAGHNLGVLCIAVLADSIANAMVASVFVAVLMSACTPAVSATQMALFTALSSLGGRLLAPASAWLVTEVGWAGFFVTAALLAVPGLVVARRIGRAGGQEFAAGDDPS